MWYLKSAFDTYEKVQDAVQNRLGEIESAILSPVDLMKKLLATPQPVQPGTESQSEIDSLRKRVIELEWRLATQKPPKRRQTKKVSVRLTKSLGKRQS